MSTHQRQRCATQKSPNHLSALGAERGNFQPKQQTQKQKTENITKWAFGFCEGSQLDWEAISAQNRSGMFWWWSARAVWLPAIKFKCRTVGGDWLAGRWDLRKLDTRKNAPKWLFNWVVKLSDDGCRAPTPRPSIVGPTIRRFCPPFWRNGKCLRDNWVLWLTRQLCFLNWHKFQYVAYKCGLNEPNAIYLLRPPLLRPLCLSLR